VGGVGEVPKVGGCQRPILNKINEEENRRGFGEKKNKTPPAKTTKRKKEDDTYSVFALVSGLGSPNWEGGKNGSSPIWGKRGVYGMLNANHGGTGTPICGEVKDP